jgi:hypothetical protein
LSRHDGDFDEYLEWKRARSADAGTEDAEQAAEGPGRARQERRGERRREAEERNRRYRERKAIEERLAPVEQEVTALEQRVRRLEQAQARPEVYSDPVEARNVALEKAEAERRLLDLYERWERLAAELS